ncbi:MAG: hypothetical protein PHR35_12090, partial [Kiritimatiellae bacterium]|nr:hypothetical protein [Kiritimatiellia bacterium]
PASALLFVTAGLFSVTRSLAGIAWSSWLHEIVHPSQLGRFFTAETVMTRMLAVAFGVFCFLVIGSNPPLWRFAAVAGMGVTFGLLSVRFLRLVPGGGAVSLGGKTPRGSYRQVLRDHMFVGFLGCAAWFGFVYTGMGLLVMLLLRDHLGFGAGLILLLTTCGNLLAIPTTARWRRIADSHGSPVAMAGAGLLACVCLLAIGCLRPGHAPLPLVAAICALIPVAECGHYVATNRGYMLRMRPDLRHATNAVWSAGTNVCCGVSAVMMGFWLRRGEAMHYAVAAWLYAAVMLLGLCLCVRLPVPAADRSLGPSPVHDQEHPVRSLLRVLRYVLRPGRSSVVLREGACVGADTSGHGLPATNGEK